MGYRVGGISLAFTKAPAVTSGVFNIGDVVGLDTNSKVVTASAGLISFPLSETFDGAAEQAACIQMTGIAYVKITVVTGIDVDSRLMWGTGNGGILATAGSKSFGKALQKPTVANQIIPVLLEQTVVQTA